MVEGNTTWQFLLTETSRWLRASFILGLAFSSRTSSSRCEIYHHPMMKKPLIAPRGQFSSSTHDSLPQNSASSVSAGGSSSPQPLSPPSSSSSSTSSNARPSPTFGRASTPTLPAPAVPASLASKSPPMPFPRPSTSPSSSFLYPFSPPSPCAERASLSSMAFSASASSPASRVSSVSGPSCSPTRMAAPTRRGTEASYSFGLQSSPPSVSFAHAFPCFTPCCTTLSDHDAAGAKSASRQRSRILHP